MSLGVESEGGTVQNSLLAISESVICWVDFPVVISLLLFTWGVVSVSLSVHRSGTRIISNKSSTNWIKHILSTLKPLGWHTETVGILVLDMLWPVVLAAKSMAQRLSVMRGVFSLFNVIKLISQTGKSLGLNNLIYWVGSIS